MEMYKFILEHIANIIFSCWHRLSSTAWCVVEIRKHLLLKQLWENKWQIINYIPNPQHQCLPCITAKIFNNFLFQGGQYFPSSSLIINPLLSFLFLVDKVGKDVERHLVDIRETMINDDEDDEDDDNDDDDDGNGIQGMLFFMRNS